MDIRVVFYFVLVLLSSCLFTLTYGIVRTCRGKTTCQGLRDCAPVMSLIGTLHKPLKPSVVHFLRSQQCGFADGHPKICCGVLPKTLNIFGKANKSKPKQPQHQIKLNRAPSTALNVNKLSVYQPESTNISPPHFDITVSTAPPNASPVPYLKNLQRDDANSFLNTGEFKLNDEVSNYMENFDLQRTRRSGVEDKLDVEVR